MAALVHASAKIAVIQKEKKIWQLLLQGRDEDMNGRLMYPKTRTLLQI